MERTYTIEEVEQALERLRTPSDAERELGIDLSTEGVVRFALTGAQALVKALRGGMDAKRARSVLLRDTAIDAVMDMLVHDAENAMRTPPPASREG